jgi:ribosomal protein L11 methyltransferase
MDTIQISIEANTELQEILVSELAELGAEGFEQTDSYLVAYFNQQTFMSYEVNELLKPYNSHVQTIKEQNWNAVWESNFQPVIVPGFCAIRAEFHEPIKGVEHEIIITPKMSFGTGHHATTFMMMEQMKDLDFTNKNVFDFGTGTGILAILAEKLGAGRIDAIDVEEWSIKNAEENSKRNNCNKISLSLGSQLPSGSFDIILANINRNVILEYLSEVKLRINKGGSLLLSGLLNTDKEVIVKACNLLELQLVKQTEKNTWISLLFINGK